MSDNETLADILAEMRQHIKAARDFPHDIDIATGDVEDWADRIEAAYARESGNAAAMRKALDKIHLIATTNINECVGDESDIHIVNLANAALAAPARNCDRYRTAEEARLAFWDTHEAIWDEFKNRGGTELFYEVIDWLFAKAEGGAEC